LSSGVSKEKMIRASNLYLSFGDQVLFEDVKFTINSGERVGLVGLNGSGKTTLLNLLSKQISPDAGTVSLPREYSVGYVVQEPGYSCSTVLAETCIGLKAEHKNDTWRVEKILTGLGFTTQELHQNPVLLSNGFQARLNLAKVLAGEPDLLLLDEPTNYLDIVAIRWLERHLNAWRGESVIVTHDRSFMDRVTTHTMMIHRHRIRKIRGDTTKLYNQIAKEEEIYEKTRINDEKRRREIELFIDRFRAKARLAGLVQSRIKSLQKKGVPGKLKKMEKLDFSFSTAPFSAKYIIESRDISFSYSTSSPPLIDHFSIVIGKRERIGIIGKNGKGKSTLLRLLAGDLKPAKGEISFHPSSSVGYFGQSGLDTLSQGRTVEEELGSASGDRTRREILGVAGAMMFGGDGSQKKINLLSGGEKSRVLLGKILLTPVNILLLDEPTNHLDMESCDSLMTAIDRFPGAVVIVTHNEMFLRTLTTTQIVFDDAGSFVYRGSYDEFLDDRGWQDEKKLKSTGSDRRRDNTLRKELRIRRAEVVLERSRVLRPLKDKMRDTEMEIERFEEMLQINNKTIVEAAASRKGNLLSKLQKKNHELRARLEKLYSTLDDLLKELEKQSAFFNGNLKNLQG
jgi:ATP-binding cassette subfamily F protein 3